MIRLKSTNFLHKLLNRNPLYFTLIYIIFIWVVLLSTIYLEIDLIVIKFPRIFHVISIIVTFVPILMTFYHILYFKKSVDSFIRLFSLYIQIVLLFGTIYFIMQTGLAKKSFLGRNIHYSFVSENPISGINNDWVTQIVEQNSDKLGTLSNALLSYLDCLHFSLVTSSTVGYGDMIPKTIQAKLIVDFQILISFLIVAFGIGIFLSNKDRKEEFKIVKTLDLDEKDIIEANDNQLDVYKTQLERRISQLNNTLEKVSHETEVRSQK
ncbi:MAG TPA: potassium channel family protein [Victivallales bacterium]|nr:potassium channel family protein [Victivallales bacterium]